MIALVILLVAWGPVGYFAVVGFGGQLSSLAIPAPVAATAARAVWIGTGSIAAVCTTVLLYSLTRGRVRLAVFRRCGVYLVLEYLWLVAGLVFTWSITGALP